MSPSEHVAPSSPLAVGEGEGRGGRGGEGRGEEGRGGDERGRRGERRGGEGMEGEGRDGDMEWILAMKECVGVHVG